MKNYFLFFSLIFLLSCEKPTEIPVIFSTGDDGQQFAIEVGTSEVPYLVITTEGKEVKYGADIVGKLKLYKQKKLAQEQRITISYRGKTSFRLSDKKAYNLETISPTGEGMDVSFLGMPAEEDWRLIGQIVNLKDKYQIDKSLLHNYIGYEISRKIGKYASRGQLVEIEVNGVYQGVYFFCEKIKRDNNRVNIKSLNATSTNLTGGYILKIDKADAGPEHDGKPDSYFMTNWNDDATYNEFNSFRSKFDINTKEITFPPFLAPYHPQKFLETYFTYDYPKAEEITKAQKEYIAKYIDQFERALITDDLTGNTRTYTNFIVLTSFVDYFIINELCRNVDAYRISTFLEKDRDGRLAMGPVWDMNQGFDDGGRTPMNEWVANYNKYVTNDAWMVPFWWDRLLADPLFRNAVKVRWQAIRKSELSTAAMHQLVDDAAETLKKSGAASRNYKTWDKGLSINYDQSIQRLKQTISERSAWMDSKINGW